jgi:hypothetical protein
MMNHMITFFLFGFLWRINDVSIRFTRPHTHHRFIPDITFVNENCLYEAVCVKYSEIQMTKGWVFLHYNSLVTLVTVQAVKDRPCYCDDIASTVLFWSCVVQLLCIDMDEELTADMWLKWRVLEIWVASDFTVQEPVCDGIHKCFALYKE